jgi:hypothetical protein
LSFGVVNRLFRVFELVLKIEVDLFFILIFHLRSLATKALLFVGVSSWWEKLGPVWDDQIISSLAVLDSAVPILDESSAQPSIMDWR